MKRKTKNKRNLITVVLVILGLGVVALITFLSFKFFGLDKLFANDKPNITNTTTNTPVATNTPSSNQNNNQPAQTPTQDYQEKPQVIQYSGDNPNGADQLTGAITYTGIINDTLAIRVNIDQYIGEGNCILTLTGSSTNYTEAAKVADSASTATCEGFNVPLSIIQDKVLNISIEVSADGKKGIIQGEAKL